MYRPDEFCGAPHDPVELEAPAEGSGVASDPFKRIAQRANASTAHGVDERHVGEGELVAPVPLDAPKPPSLHPSRGNPSQVWTYRDEAGAVLGYAGRFDGPYGKEVLPLTLWRVGQRLEWKWRAFTDPRPLYGLPALAEKPDALVMVVEGEKTADAAAKLFPAFAVVSWPGGAKATGKADWSALVGRDVIMFPDADDPGRKAAEDVAKRARGVGAKTVSVVHVPGFLPKGWDLADAWRPDFGPTEVAAAIEAARKEGSCHLPLPYGYNLDAEGLWYNQPGKDGATFPIKLSASFELIGEARDSDGRGWAVVLRFEDRDGRKKTEVVPRGALTSDPGSVRARLASEGLIVQPSRGRAEKFAAFLAEVECSRRLTLVTGTGWAPGDRFVLPLRVIGPPGSEPVLFTGDAAGLHYRCAGTLESWRDQVAAVASGNSLLLLALSIAFAGPLLRPLGLEGGGFHFRGPSSCGKTSLAYAAGSVWGGGGPLGAAHSWRTTANALEMLAHGHSDTLLVLDELGLVAPEEAGQAAYALASGQAKARARTDGTLRGRPEWRAIMLSTGEIGLADHIRASKRGERAMAGQELRLLDVAADGGKGLGVWEALHGALGPAEFSDALKTACDGHFGHAGPVFVEQFVADFSAAKAEAREIMRAFMASAKRHDDHGQVHRAALRFALVAAAGELATRFGILPWGEREAFDAALTVFNRWASAFGRTAPRERRDVLRTLVGAIEQHQSRFAELGGGEWSSADADCPRDARSLSALGFLHLNGPHTYYLFTRSGWDEVFRSYDPQYAARTVLEAGFLEAADGRHLMRAKKVRGQNRRFYWVKADILEADFDG